MLNFTAIIKKPEGVNGAYIEIPFDIEKIFGLKRVKVKARFDNYEYRGSIVSMSGCYIIGITKDIREKLNKNYGDSILVTIEKDDEERIVVLQKDFEVVLKDNHEAKENYEKLSYTNKKKFNIWIESAKKEETRNLRINKAIEMLINNEILK